MTLALKYGINSSIHLFFKSRENMGELRNAAFASCWRSAAMETKQIWTWVFSCSFIYCFFYYYYYSKVWLRAGNIYFFSNLLNFEFLLFFSVYFFSIFFSTVTCSLLFWYLKCFLDVLCFHSRGIVGIMTVWIYQLTFVMFKYAKRERSCGIVQRTLICEL